MSFGSDRKKGGVPLVAATSTWRRIMGRDTRCLVKVLERRGEERAGEQAAISQPTTERDCTAGRGISKESYSAGCQAVCSASAY